YGLVQGRRAALSRAFTSKVLSMAFCLRSEEHTSELQSLTNLVCRLLLEKKKKKEDTLVIVVNSKGIYEQAQMTDAKVSTANSVAHAVSITTIAADSQSGSEHARISVS